MENKKVETVAFKKIKKGHFFRTAQQPSRLYQKFSGRYGQVVAGPKVGTANVFWVLDQVIPVRADIIVQG